MNCAYCSEKATYYAASLRHHVCDRHADQCAKMGIVVREIKNVPKPVSQADRAY